MRSPTLGYVLAALAVWCLVAYGALAKPGSEPRHKEIACLR